MSSPVTGNRSNNPAEEFGEQMQATSLIHARSARAAGAVLVALALSMAQTTASFAQGRPGSFADLAENVSPSVVNITTSTTIAARSGPAPVVPEGSPFEDFFRDFMDRNGPQQQAPRRSQALGSGFIVSEDGFIVTNNHVIDGADEISIEFFEGGELPATVVGIDAKTDIALLKVEPSQPLPFVRFGDSDTARVGDWVMAMGNPLGQGFSVSVGIISARNRALSGAYDDFIQTDAAINRGNSGGPLFNMDGDVIGVNTAILSPNGGSIGIGFSMSSNVVARVVDQLQTYGETRRGWLGVRIQDVSADIAESIGLAQAAGALVTDIPEGPAMDAGMLPGDVIVSFDGQDVADTRDLVTIVGNSEIGKTVRVVVWRDNASTTLRVTLGRREDAEAAIPVVVNRSEPLQGNVMGLTVSGVTDALREQFSIPAGTDGLVITAIEPASDAFDKSMREGDVITEAGQQPVTTPAELEQRIQAARDAGRKSILLLVRRAGEPRFVALPVDQG